MINIKLIIKGFFVGIAKIIPGVSGSLLAVSLGLYNKAIEAISNPFKNFKENIIFLGNVGIGVLIAIILCSNIVLYFLNKYFFITVILFIGFIIGSIPSFLNDIKISDKKDYLFIVLFTLLIVFLSSFKNDYNFIYDRSIVDNILIVLFGFIDAAAMVIPGISGTAIFLLIGCYSFVLGLFSSLSNIFFLDFNLFPIVLFFIGVFIGIIIVSKIMNYMLKKYKKNTYLCIVGCALSSVILLTLYMFSIDFSLIELIIGLFLFIIGYKISYKLNK